MYISSDSLPHVARNSQTEWLAERPRGAAGRQPQQSQQPQAGDQQQHRRQATREQFGFFFFFVKNSGNKGYGSPDGWP